MEGPTQSGADQVSRMVVILTTRRLEGQVEPLVVTLTLQLRTI